MTSANVRSEEFEPADGLLALAELANDAGAGSIAAEARALAGRTRERRFYVACVGQFKRGKSTLLNALIAEPILPMGVVPVTAVVTIVRYGERLRARVELEHAGWRDIEPSALAAYVTEDGNPENAKAVRAVEVFVPSPLLAGGMCLVDTPGLGSVFKMNTATTRAFVPHIDAALVVLGGDPPISGEELDMVNQIATEMPDMIFVLNKADRLSAAERLEASEFTARVVTARLGHPIGRMFEVSASEQLAGRPSSEEWIAFENTLRELAEQSGMALVEAAAERGKQRLGRALLFELAEGTAALERPLAESEARLETLRTTVTDARRALADLRHLFAAEQERLGHGFAAHRERFLTETRPAAQTELCHAIASAGERPGPALRRSATTMALDLSRRHVAAWMREVEPIAEELYRKATLRFVTLANEFIERLTEQGPPELARVSGPVEPELGFRTRSRFYHHELVILSAAPPGAWLRDHLFPRSRVLSSIQHDAAAYLTRLLEANSTRFEDDLDERVLESRRQVEHEIQGRLREVTSAAERALDLARRRQAEGAAAIGTELARFEAIQRRVEALLREPAAPQLPSHRPTHRRDARS